MIFDQDQNVSAILGPWGERYNKEDWIEESESESEPESESESSETEVEITPVTKPNPVG